MIIDIIKSSTNNMLSKQIACLLGKSLFFKQVQPYIQKTSNYHSDTGMTPIHYKILQQKTLQDYFAFYADNKNEFNNGSTMGFSSKVILKLYQNATKDRKQPLDKTPFVEYLTHLKQSNVDEMSIVNITSVMQFFRKMKHFIGPQYGNQMRDFIAKVQKKVMEECKSQSTVSLPNLINLYYEIVVTKGWSSRHIADKISNLLVVELQEKQRIGLSNNHIIFILHSIGQKEVLTPSQKKIRKICAEKISKSIESLKEDEVVKMAINLNKMDNYDFSRIEHILVQNLNNKIINNIHEFFEDTVQLILRSQVNPTSSFRKIYDALIQQIVSEMKDDGDTKQIASQIIMNLLTHAASKKKISQYLDKDAQKTMKFLLKYGQKVKDTREKGNFLRQITSMVEHQFFSTKQSKSQLIKILEEIQVSHISVYVLYQFSIRSFNLVNLIQSDLVKKIERMDIKLAFKVFISLKRQLTLNPEDAKITKLIEEIQPHIHQCFKDPQTFSRSSKMLDNSQIYSNIRTFCDEQFKSLPDPFGQTPLQLPPDVLKKYEHSYLIYKIKSLHFGDLNRFLNICMNKISLNTIKSIVQSHLQDNKYNITPERYIPLLLVKKFFDAIKNKDKRFLQLTTQVIVKYSRYIIYKTLSQDEMRIVDTLTHQIISNYNNCKEMKLDNNVHEMIESLLVNKGCYSFGSFKKDVVKHSLSILSQLPTKSRIVPILIENGLELNIIRAEHLAVIDIDSLRLGFNDKERLRYIQDKSYVPTISNYSVFTLDIVLSNHNCVEMIKDNYEKIEELINIANPNKLSKYLVIFNQRKTKESYQIQKNILKKLLSLQQDSSYDFMNFIGIFDNFVKNDYSNIIEYRKLFNNILKKYTKGSNKYSIQSHAEILKFCSYLGTPNSKEYFSKVASIVQKERSPQLKGLIFTRLLSTSYQFPQENINHIFNFIQDKISLATYSFMIFQDRFDEATRKDFVGKLFAKYKLLEKNIDEVVADNSTEPVEPIVEIESQKRQKRLIKNTYLQYLKKKYPEETSGVQIPQKYIYEDQFSIKPRQVILEFLNKLKEQPYHLAEGFNNNFLPIFNNYLLIFTRPNRNGATLQQNVWKKLIAEKYPQKIVICINHYNNQQSMVFYLNSYFKGFISDEQKVSLDNKIKQYYNKKLSTDNESVTGNDL